MPIVHHIYNTICNILKEMSDFMPQIAIVALFIIILTLIYSSHLQNREWQKERKDLYDRIMSKDLQEYKDAIEPVKIYKPVDNSEEAEWKKEQEARKV